jgi:uncharacterized damage-inducible protein DinB
MPLPERETPAIHWDEAELARAVDEIERNPEKVIAFVRSLDDATLRHRAHLNKWCALEIMAHLADVELIYGFRMRQIYVQPGATIAPVDQDGWARSLHYLQQNVPELIERYRVNRRANVQLLRRLTLDDLKRSAWHPEYDDEFSLADLLKFMRGHDLNHLAQIQRLAQHAGAAGAP